MFHCVGKLLSLWFEGSSCGMQRMGMQGGCVVFRGKSWCLVQEVC